jgi:hypothetical protein
MEYPPPTSRFATPQHNQLSRLGEFQFSFQPLPPVPEDAEHRGEDTRAVGANFIGGIAPLSNSGEPTPKKQRIESFKCAGCNEIIAAKNALLRHQRGCNKYCAKTNTPLSSYKCQVCGLTVKRLDVLRRHVQRKHEDQGSGRPQDSGSIVQQGSFDTLLELQGSEQPSAITRPWDVSSFEYTALDSITYKNNAGPYWHTTDITAVELADVDQMEIDPQIFTTPAATPDLQSSGYVGLPSEDDRALDQSGISYQGTSTSASSNQLTPATSKLSPAGSVHEVAATVDCEVDDDARLVADAALVVAMEQKLSLHEVPYASAKPVSQGRNLRSRRIRNPIPCPLCGDELGNGPNDNGEVKLHLDRHIKRMKAITVNTVHDSEAFCTDCRIHFLDTRDLKRHRESVRTDGGCGFLFIHINEECTGHHPPTTEGQTNPDHDKFTDSLRKWEGFQRRAFQEYVNAYVQGTAPTNAPAYGLFPRRRAFQENVDAYSKGMAPIGASSYNVGQLSCRKSTGSIYSAKSLSSSFKSTISTPVRFRFGGKLRTNGITGRFDPPDTEDLARRHTGTLANKYFGLVTRMSSRTNVNLPVKTDSFWSSVGLDPTHLTYLSSSVEQSLSISKKGVEHLAVALNEAASEPLLFAESSPLAVQSRLVQCVFLCAVLRGHDSLVSKLLKSGILETIPKLPDSEFIEKFHPWDATMFDETFLSTDESSGTGPKLGPYALTLALSARQYLAAGALIEHRVASYWGVRHFGTSYSAQRDLQDELHNYRSFGILVPRYLSLLERELLGTLPMSLYNDTPPI